MKARPEQLTIDLIDELMSAARALPDPDGMGLNELIELLEVSANRMEHLYEEVTICHTEHRKRGLLGFFGLTKL